MNPHEEPFSRRCYAPIIVCSDGWYGTSHEPSRQMNAAFYDYTGNTTTNVLT